MEVDGSSPTGGGQVTVEMDAACAMTPAQRTEAAAAVMVRGKGENEGRP
jgi:RNA 3'-terminal phosphate cyclase